MKKPKLKFICSKCNRGVYRYGKHIDVPKKICGFCNTGRVPFVNIPENVKSVPEEAIEVPATNVTSVPAVLNNTQAVHSYKEAIGVSATIEMYRKILLKVEELHKQYPNDTFLELWHTAKMKGE